MENNKNTFSSLLTMSQKLAAQEVTSVDLTRAALDRIQRHPSLGAFLAVDDKGALEAAQQADERILRGQRHGPLDGIPVAHKDLLCTQGVVTTAGSKILEGYVPPYDATVVEQWKQQGVVMLGKLNLDEFAMGSSNENSAYFLARNPWNLERTPGGSSGGSAAAVAAGLCFGATGTDTGGSIRQPAALSGVVGIKPTYGRVSRFGCIAYASSLDQVGVLARTVGDAALLLQPLAKHDPKDSTSAHALTDDYSLSLSNGVSGKTVGLPVEYFSAAGVDPQVLQAVQQACAQLESQGARLKELSLPHTHLALASYYIIASAEASSNLARYDGVRFGPRRGQGGNLRDMYEQTRGELLGQEVKRRILLGTYVLSAGYHDAYYGQAQRARRQVALDFEEAFKTVDVIASPTTPTAAFKLGEKVNDPLSMYLSDVFTLPCNLAGLPGMSIPCGMTSQNLPVGLQLLARPFAESTLFAVGHAYEQSTPWHTLHPTL